MNVFEFVIAIMIIGGLFSILRHKMGMPPEDQRERGELAAKNEDNERLRQQVLQLQDRIKVLERIVTDSGVQTAAQIEALRDQDRLEQQDRV